MSSISDTDTPVQAEEKQQSSRPSRSNRSILAVDVWFRLFLHIFWRKITFKMIRRHRSTVTWRWHCRACVTVPLFVIIIVAAGGYLLMCCVFLMCCYLCRRRGRRKDRDRRRLAGLGALPHDVVTKQVKSNF